MLEFICTQYYDVYHFDVNHSIDFSVGFCKIW